MFVSTSDANVLFVLIKFVHVALVQFKLVADEFVATIKFVTLAFVLIKLVFVTDVTFKLATDNVVAIILVVLVFVASKFCIVELSTDKFAHVIIPGTATAPFPFIVSKFVFPNSPIPNEFNTDPVDT
jgi:hypothetical protein